MKKLIGFLAIFLCLGAFPAAAQSALDSNILTLTVRKPTAYYVAAFNQDPAIQTAIASAVSSTLVSDTVVSVTVSEAQVVRIVRTLTEVPEGIAAAPNKELMTVLTPLLPSHPNLYVALVAILADNASALGHMQNAGKASLDRILRAINLN